VIRVRELSKRYGALLALDGLDFELGRGEILGLLGPNGAGKTTTLRLLTGFMPPDGGRVEIDGRDLVDLGPALRRRSGYLPESTPHYPELNALENLEFWGALYGLRGPALAAAIARVLAGCGLAEVARRPLRELSKGYRQRLGLAQALLHDPDLVFLDEPTAGLDPLHVRELRAMIRSFAGDKTVVLCTHILSEVEAVCDHVLILDRGRCVLQGALADLGHRFGSGGRYELRVQLPAGEAWAGAPGLRSAQRLEAGPPERWRVELDPEPEAPAALAAWLHAAGGRLYEQREQAADLEEVFLQVIGGSLER
jgi:ABC-2 type transport system ATP-binding protein